ncbi:hypothetical protein [Sphaerotilus sp.]|uniref:hypothetical protein n=1 Tax=Sphaerotilus sp. TaxID=2093942 RepID=UPI00286D9B20|nr:hypothetical protein [Sphaerotilus sp.]
MTGSRHPTAQTGMDGQRLHLDVLRSALLPTVEFLSRRRADLIDTALIEDYVALNWMEWHGGSLRLTVTGRNVCAQLATRAK